MNLSTNTLYQVALSCVPCRAEPSDRSEMVNQLLFGECYHTQKQNDKWLHIKSLHDNYSGWIDLRQHEESLRIDPAGLGHSKKVISKSAVLQGSHNNLSLLLSPGSDLSQACHGEIGLKGDVFAITGEYGIGTKNRLREFAFMFLNTPYLWGGRTIWGIDCSGFTQVVFAMLGKQIPRDASQQALLGDSIALHDSIEGDLAFFQNERGNVTHVGITLSNKEIIHASGKVRVDYLDEKGIQLPEQNRCSHTLHSIKRI